MGQTAGGARGGRTVCSRNGWSHATKLFFHDLSAVIGHWAAAVIWSFCGAAAAATFAATQRSLDAGRVRATLPVVARLASGGGVAVQDRYDGDVKLQRANNRDLRIKQGELSKVYYSLASSSLLFPSILCRDCSPEYADL